MIKPELLVRMPNWVGDTIMALPAIEQLRSHGIALTLMGRPWIHSLLSGMDIPLVTWPRGFKDGVSCLRKQMGKKVLLLTNSFSSAMIAKCAGKDSLGYANEGRSMFLSQSIKKNLNNNHETIVFHQLAIQALQYWFDTTINSSDSILTPQLNLKSSTINTAKQLLNQHDIPSRFIVLCPFAQGLTKQKQIKKWPFWPDLIKQLGDYYPIICPGPSEAEEAHSLLPKKHILENLPLDVYAGILSCADLVISNDSGPMHIAAALNRPTLGLFGVTDPKRTGPQNARILGQHNQWPSLHKVLDSIQ